MTKLPLLILPFLVALAACGRQEPVQDMPTEAEIAAAAKAAAASAAANVVEPAPEENRNHVDPDHGFSITFPEGWTRDAAASTSDGVVFQDPGAGADVRVFWQKNDNDQALQQIVEAMNSGSDSVEGSLVSDTEYRGTASDGEGNSVAIRLLKQPGGSIVTATFVYPEMLSEQYNAIAKATLDSLRIFPPKGAEPAAAGNAAP
jgi:predicted small lipoprotein YifL